MSQLARNARTCAPHTDAAKHKLRAAHIGKQMSPEARQRMSLAKRGNQNAAGSVRSPETRAKISATKRAQAAAQKLAAAGAEK